MKHEPLKQKFAVTVLALSHDETFVIECNLNRMTKTTLYNRAKSQFVAIFGKKHWELEVFNVKYEVLNDNNPLA